MQRIIFISLPDLSAAFTSIDSPVRSVSSLGVCYITFSWFFCSFSGCSSEDSPLLFIKLLNVGVLQDSVTSPLFSSAFLLKKSHPFQGFNYYDQTTIMIKTSKFSSPGETTILSFRPMFLTTLSTSPSKHQTTISENNISLDKFNS